MFINPGRHTGWILAMALSMATLVACGDEKTPPSPAVDTTPPSAPGTPAAPAAFSLAPVTFTWTAATDDASGIASYLLQIGTTTTGADLVFDADVGNQLTHTFTGTDGQTLYARVAAKDGKGNQGPWSSFSSAVTVDLSGPVMAAAPTLSSAWVDDTLTVSWATSVDAGSGTASHVLQVASATDGSGVLFDLDVGSVLTYDVDTSGWAEATPLYARVAGVDALLNQGGWSPFSTLATIDRTGPVAPAAPTPAGAYSVQIIVFGWTATTDAASGVASYVVEVATANDGTNIEVSANAGMALTYELDAASGYSDGDVFYARVAALDSAGNQSAWSPFSTGLTLDLAPPSTPAAPVDEGSISRLTTVSFSWTAATDAVSGVSSYDAQIATAADEAAVVQTQTLGNVLSTTHAGTNGQTLYARVRAHDGVGRIGVWSPWSDGVTLDSNVPGQPNAPTDAGVYTSNTTIQFNWTPPVGSVSYYAIQIGTTPGAQDVFASANIGGATTYNLDAASRTNGETYYARVAGVDAAGHQGVWSLSSNGIKLDTTEPSVPGVPTDRGDLDDRMVTFNWTAAADPQSTVVSYDLRIWVGGSSVIHVENGITGLTYTFDAGAYHTQNLAAHVRANNGAGLSSAFSALSDGIDIDAQAPGFWVDPNSGWSSVGVATDIEVSFDEPMDIASVTPSTIVLTENDDTPLRNGFAFVWNTDHTRLFIMPDTQDPVGVSNIDVLAGNTAYKVTVTDQVRDIAGNAVGNPRSETFTTLGDVEPTLTSLMAGSTNLLLAPANPTDVAGSDTLTLTFGQDMRADSGRVEIRGSQYYANAGFQTMPIFGATTHGSTVTYRTYGHSGIVDGMTVTVSGTDPSSFDTTGVAQNVTTSDSEDTFDLANTTNDTYQGGGSAAYAMANGAQASWSDARTFVLTLDADNGLAGAQTYALRIDYFQTTDGYGYWNEVQLQVLAAAGTDTSAPIVTTTVPQNGATGVARMGGLIVVAFNEPLDLFTTATIGISGTGGVTADDFISQYESAEMGNLFMFMPRRALPAGAVITVVVPATVRDLGGNALAAPVTFSFTTASTADAVAPVIAETLPPSSTAVWNVYNVELSVKNGSAGLLEPLDAATVDDDDILVTNTTTGLIRRGFHLRYEPGSSSLNIESSSYGAGFQPDGAGVNIESVSGTGMFATYVTSAAHGLVAGNRVWINGVNDGSFNTDEAYVENVPTTTSFVIYSTATGTSTGGWASWNLPAAYEVRVSRGTGFTDAYGNLMAEDSWTFTMAPPPVNRPPMPRSLRDVYVSVASSPAGRALQAYASFEDADGDSVTVTLTGAGVSLSETPGGNDYRYPPGDGGGGPPSGADPAGMNDINYPTSGYYPFVFSLDDGQGTTQFTRDVWVWTPADVPNQISVAGVAKSSSLPTLVDDPTPTFAWDNVDQANADLLAIYLVEMSALGNDNGDSNQGMYVQLLNPAMTTFDLPANAALDVNLYLWAMVQMKLGAGGDGPDAQGWSLDFASQGYEPFLVYGPTNAALAEAEYGVADAGVYLNNDRTFDGMWDITGTYTFAAGASPTTLTHDLYDNWASRYTGTGFFGYDSATKAFVVARSLGGGGLPMPARGSMTRNGELFMVAQATTDQEPYLTVGSKRFATTGFTGASLVGDWVVAQWEVGVDGGGVLNGIGGSVGTATATFSGTGSLAVAIKHEDGSTANIVMPYAVADDGRVAVQIDTTANIHGYIGGSAGHEIVALASDTTADKAFFLVLAKAHAWGSETAASLAGLTYQFTNMGLGVNDIGGGHFELSDSWAGWGTVTFDGTGGYGYEFSTINGGMSGTGNYTVNAGTGRVTLDNLELVAGPDLNTLMGISVDDGNRVDLIFLSR